MAWRQSAGGSERHLTRAAATARTELNSQENIWQFMRQNWLSNRIFKSFDYRPLLLRPEHTHRPTLEDYVHRATRMGSSRSLNLRIGISLRA